MKLIAEELSVLAQASDVIANRFDSGSQRDRQDQSSGVPKKAPEHQRHRHHQWIQVYPRTHEFRIKEVQRQDMEQHDYRAEYYVRRHSLEDHEGYHQRGGQSQRQTEIRHQTEKAAERSGQ